MLKNNFFLLGKLVVIGMVLFLFFDAISVLLATFLVYFKTESFLFNWKDIFTSFFRTGYLGGFILGVGLWIKVKLQERKDKEKGDG
ncbi:hypothetical protein MUA01_02920 [Enterobacteriaceae bacterium H18W14]|uniref:hypothetical protein n=1 Tax=Dryocola boscaweniae TaxID=2925397 RepID=UPI0022F04ED4|nr:hypothetical protein [Dryocola boscaweniae]MCT4713945.1 hypothetical protein [Dryocola boscaweniae]